ncbi:hypothetical protein OROMI_010663 [Orobanche minor]
MTAQSVISNEYVNGIEDEGGAGGLAPAAQLVKEEERERGGGLITGWPGGTPSSKDVKPATGPTLITVYASLACGICFCTIAVDLLVGATGYITAIIVFKNMVETIFRAPMEEFSTDCSTDQSVLETRISPLLQGIISDIILLVGIIAVMSTVAWEVLVIFIPFIFASI